jgi:hypothetical protein
MNTSPGQNFNLLRRFATLNTRCLLYLQDDLSEMEAAMAGMDKSEFGSSSRRRDAHPHRPRLMEQILEKLSTYSKPVAYLMHDSLIVPGRARLKALQDSLLLQRSELMRLLPASSYQYKMFNRFIEARQPLLGEEIESLRHPEDLVSIGGPERDWLHRMVEEKEWPIFTGQVRWLIQPNDESTCIRGCLTLQSPLVRENGRLPPTGHTCSTPRQPAFEGSSGPSSSSRPWCSC